MTSWPVRRCCSVDTPFVMAEGSMERKTDNYFVADRNNCHGTVPLSATGNNMLTDLYNLTDYANIIRFRCTRETVTFQSMLKTKIMTDIT
jgi:hypothetical protein